MEVQEREGKEAQEKGTGMQKKGGAAVSGLHSSKCTDGKRAYGKIFHFICDQENANKNNNEIPLHTYPNGANPNTDNTKCWQGCRATATLIHC